MSHQEGETTDLKTRVATAESQIYVASKSGTDLTMRVNSLVDTMNTMQGVIDHLADSIGLMTKALRALSDIVLEDNPSVPMEVLDDSEFLKSITELEK